MSKAHAIPAAILTATLGVSLVAGTAQAEPPASVSPTQATASGPLSAGALTEAFTAVAQSKAEADQAAAEAAAVANANSAASAVAAAAGNAAATLSASVTTSAAAAWAASAKAQSVVRCESGGNYAISTGNGYYGGWQFDRQSWLANGGGQYASYPHLATKEQQDQIAYNYYQKSGWRPWACA